MASNKKKLALIWIGIVVILGAAIGGYFLFTSDGDLVPSGISAEPTANLTFNEKYNDRLNVNVKVTLNSLENANRVIVKLPEKNFSEPIFRENSHTTVPDLLHNQTIEVYAVSDKKQYLVGNYTYTEEREPKASFQYQQMSQGEGQRVVVLMTEAPSISYVTADSPGYFATGSGDGRDYDGDGERKDDINIVRKRLIIDGLSSGDTITVYGNIRGRTEVVDTYTVK